MYRMGDIFWVAKISNIFCGCLNFCYFLGRTVDAEPKPTYEEKMRVYPSLLDFIRLYTCTLAERSSRVSVPLLP